MVTQRKAITRMYIELYIYRGSIFDTRQAGKTEISRQYVSVYLRDVGVILGNRA